MQGSELSELTGELFADRHGVQGDTGKGGQQAFGRRASRGLLGRPGIQTAQGGFLGGQVAPRHKLHQSQQA